MPERHIPDEPEEALNIQWEPCLLPLQCTIPHGQPTPHNHDNPTKGIPPDRHLSLTMVSPDTCPTLEQMEGDTTRLLLPRPDSNPETALIYTAVGESG